MTQSQFIQLLKKQPRLGNNPKKKKDSNVESAQLGITNFLSSIKKLLPTLEQGKQILGDFVKDTADLVTSFEASSKSINNQIAGLDALLGRSQALGKAYIEFSKRSLMLERRYQSLNKNFRVSAVEAFKLGKQFDKQAQSLNISGKQAQQYGNAIKKLLPTIRTMTDADGRKSSIQSDFFKSLTMTQRVITTNMELSEQAAERFIYFSTNQEQSAAEVLLQTQASAKAIEEATGMQGAFSMITEEIGNTSEDVLLQFGRMPGRLELAVMKGKALGLSLAEVTKIGNQMLDIESSIGAELEYQLLSGQRLVDQQTGESLTNKFREAALAGDANKQAETLNELLESQSETLENNVLARQKMADLLGMDEASLSRALMKRKLLEKEGAEVLMNLSGDDFEEAAQQMLESGQLSKKTFEEIKDLGDQRTTEKILEEQLDIQLDSLAVQQIQLISSQQFQNNQSKIMSGVTDQILKVKEGKLSANETAKLGGLVRTLDAQNALAGAATSFTAQYDAALDAEDLLYIPGQETSTGKYGDLFKLDKRDAVAAGPPAAIAAAAGGGSSTLHIDYDKLAAAMSNVKLEVTVDPKASKFAS